MNQKKYILFFVLMLFSTVGFSQRWKLSRAEYVYGIGASIYLGDIGGARSKDASGFADIDIVNTRPVLAIGYRYRIFDRFAVKANLSYANIRGSDIKSVNEERAYSFTTNLFEFNGHVEFHLTEEKHKVSYSSMSMRGRIKKMNAGMNVYLFVGVGGIFFKPKSTEGSLFDSRYVGSKNSALIIPYGLGLKYPITKKTYVGLELGRRFITSDYLDGFSPESSEYNDAYYFAVINVSYKIKKKSIRRPEYRF